MNFLPWNGSDLERSRCGSVFGWLRCTSHGLIFCGHELGDAEFVEHEKRNHSAHFAVLERLQATVENDPVAVETRGNNCVVPRACTLAFDAYKFLDAVRANASELRFATPNASVWHPSLAA